MLQYCTFYKGEWKTTLIRMFFGIPVCDDPTDTYRDLGLSIDDNVLIQMGMEGTTCGFDSRCPTLEDMASFKRITVSHET